MMMMMMMMMMMIHFFQKHKTNWNMHGTYDMQNKMYNDMNEVKHWQTHVNMQYDMQYSIFLSTQRLSRIGHWKLVLMQN
jgi:hypothetical protein